MLVTTFAGWGSHTTPGWNPGHALLSALLTLGMIALGLLTFLAMFAFVRLCDRV